MGDSELTDGAADVTLSEPRLLVNARYRYERYDVTVRGTTTQRDVVRVGRVVVVVTVDIDRDEVVLLRQFRIGAQLALGCGELVEVVAGHVEDGEDWAEAAWRECQEEIGVVPSQLVPIFSVLPSPGMSDEHMRFFLGMVDASKLPERAGAADEHEDTRPTRVPIDRALAAMAEGKLHYGAGVLGLQWLALNRGRLREIAGQAVGGR